MRVIILILFALIIVLFNNTYCSAINVGNSNSNEVYSKGFNLDFSDINLNDLFDGAGGFWNVLAGQGNDLDYDRDQQKYISVYFVNKKFIDNYLATDLGLSGNDLKYGLIQYKYKFEECISKYDSKACKLLLPKDVIRGTINKSSLKSNLYYELESKNSNSPENGEYMMILRNDGYRGWTSELTINTAQIYFSNYLNIDWDFKGLKISDEAYKILEEPFKIINLGNGLRNIDIKIEKTDRVVEDWNYIDLDFRYNFSINKINKLINYSKNKIGDKNIKKIDNIIKLLLLKEKNIDNKKNKYNKKLFIVISTLLEKEKIKKGESIKLDVLYYIKGKIAKNLFLKNIKSIDHGSYGILTHSELFLVGGELINITYLNKSILNNTKYVIDTEKLKEQIDVLDKNNIYIVNNNIFGKKIYIPNKNEYKITINHNSIFDDSSLYNFFIKKPISDNILDKYNFENLLKNGFTKIVCEFTYNNLSCLSNNIEIIPDYENILYIEFN